MIACWHYLSEDGMSTVIGPATPVVVKPDTILLAVGPSPMVVVISPSAPATIIRPSSAVAVMVATAYAVSVPPSRTATIQPPRRGAWQERGWSHRRDGAKDIYEGEYQVGARRFRGRIEVAGRGRIQAFIHDPPTERRRHPHRGCFQQIGVGTGWYILHWRRAPRNVDEALLYFDQILDESINGIGTWRGR